MKSRHINDKIKDLILVRQNYQCANKPGLDLYRLEGFICPMWDSSYYKGKFAGRCYDFDHVVEFCETHDNSEHNLQALCNVCHAHKTKHFMNENTQNKKSIVLDTTIAILENSKQCINKCDSSSTSEDIEFDCNDEPIIRTYREFIKISKISEIVITDLKNKEGYIKYKTWIELKYSAEPDFKGESDNFKNRLKKSVYNNRTYNWNKIIKDTCNKCYNPEPVIYKLKYYERAICYNYNVVILDLRYFTFKDVPNDYIFLDYDIFCDWGHFTPKTLTFGKKVVDKLLVRYIKKKSTLNKFKILCKNIFVKFNDNDTSVVFRDPDSDGISCWLSFALSKLGFITGTDFIYSKDYYSKRCTREEINKLRCIFITDPGKRSVNQMIHDFIVMGFKNIIVQTDDTKAKTLYNIADNTYDDLNSNAKIQNIFSNLPKCNLFNDWFFNDNIGFSKNICLGDDIGLNAVVKNLDPTKNNINNNSVHKFICSSGFLSMLQWAVS